MSYPAWPSNLPPPLADGSTNYQGYDNAIRSQVDGGVGKVRKRWTAMAEPFAAQIKCTQAQFDALLDFYDITLGGVLPFSWKDFRTDAAAAYRFTQRPAGVYLQGSINRWRVTLQLEVLP